MKVDNLTVYRVKGESCSFVSLILFFWFTSIVTVLLVSVNNTESNTVCTCTGICLCSPYAAHFFKHNSQSEVFTEAIQEETKVAL